MKSRVYRLAYLILLLAAGNKLRADIVIDFENLPDMNFFSAGGQNIGEYYSGVTFGPYVTGLSVTRFGGYLDSAFPPHSGDVVVWSAYDDAMTLAFTGLETTVGFWYTSLNPITLSAYDSASSLLGSVTGDANSDGSFGTSSYLEFDGTSISTVTISSAASQYVVDDLSFGPNAPSAVPEPSSVVLLASMSVALWLLRRGVR